MGRRVGRFELLNELGQGGMGTVYRAREDRSGREVALKLLHGGPQGGAARARFLREGRALARLEHPHLVQALDMGEDQGLAWLALELVDGESLAARLARRGPLPVPEALELGEALAGALAYCHAQGVVHRDVKPDNVLVRAQGGTPVLTDFGLVRELERGTSLTHTGQALGTPGYWAPEQIEAGSVPLGPACDVYGLGATLYALLTGVPPFRGELLQDFLAALSRDPAPPSALRPEVPRELDQLVLRCLARDPTRRPAAEELARSLRALRSRKASPRAGSRLLQLGGVLIALAGLLWALLRPPAARPPEGAGGAASPAPPLPDLSVAAERARALTEEARAAWSLGRNSRALELADQAVALDPTRGGRAHLLRALALYLRRRNEPGELAQAAGLARDLCQGPGDQALARALLALDRDAPAAAATELEQAVSLVPDQPESVFLRAYLRANQGQLDAAEADFRRVLELAPDWALAWFGLSVAAYRRADLDGAIAACDRALALNPEFVGCLLNRGQVLAERGDFLRGLADLDRAVELDPEDAAALTRRGAIRQSIKDPRWKEDMERALELDPLLPAAQHMDAMRRWMEGDLAGARAAFDRAVELGPDEARILANRGRFRVDTGDLAGARADLDRAVELEPSAVIIRVHRAELRQREGDRAGARADLERALELVPQGGPEQAAVRRQLERLGGPR